MKNRCPSAILWSLAPLFLIAVGCAPYSFSGGRTALVQSVHVSVFENDTAQFGLGENLTAGVIDGFVTDNQVQILNGNVAEALLTGRITNYERKAYTFDENDQVSEYIVEIYVAAELERRDGSGAVWSQPGIRGFGVYSAEADETTGQELAIERITEDIINHTIRSW